MRHNLTNRNERKGLQAKGKWGNGKVGWKAKIGNCKEMRTVEDKRVEQRHEERDEQCHVHREGVEHKKERQERAGCEKRHGRKGGKNKHKFSGHLPPFLPHVHFCPARGGAAILKLEETKLAEREQKNCTPTFPNVGVQASI